MDIAHDIDTGAALRPEHVPAYLAHPANFGRVVRISPRPVVDLGERQGRTLTGYGRGAPATPRTSDGVASPSVA